MRFRTNFVVVMVASCLLMTLCSCTPEKLSPEAVAHGIARLTVHNFAHLIKAINHFPSTDSRPECKMADLRYVKDKTTIQSESNGLGAATWEFQDCEFDFGSEGKTIEFLDSCGTQKTTVFGKVKISGTRKIAGIITENENTPVIPSPGKIDFSFTKVSFENYRAESADITTVMTIASGRAAFDVVEHLAKDSESQLCKLPLPNMTFRNIRFSHGAGEPETIVRLRALLGELQAVVDSSDLHAQVGTFDAKTNHLEGTISVWGQNSLVCDPKAQISVGETCSSESAIATGVARMTVSNLAHFLRAVALINYPSTDADKDKLDSCRLGALDHPATQVVRTEKKLGDVIWKFTNCTYDFGPDGALIDKVRLFGKVTASGERRIFGRPTHSKKFPVEPRSDKLFFHFTELNFHNYRVEDPSSNDAMTLESGSVAFDLVVHLAKKNQLLPNPTFENIRYLERTRVLLNDMRLSLDGSDFAAQVGKFDQQENHLSGSLNIFGSRMPIPNDSQQLDTKYTAWTPLKPPLKNFESNLTLQEKDIRSLFADIIDPPACEKEQDEGRLKRILAKHSDVIYELAHRPELLTNSGVPKELEAWIQPLFEPLRGLERSDVKEGIIAGDDDDFAE